jgi:hypothetical protein
MDTLLSIHCLRAPALAYIVSLSTTLCRVLFIDFLSLVRKICHVLYAGYTRSRKKKCAQMQERRERAQLQSSFLFASGNSELQMDQSQERRSVLSSEGNREHERESAMGEKLEKARQRQLPPCLRFLFKDTCRTISRSIEGLSVEDNRWWRSTRKRQKRLGRK